MDIKTQVYDMVVVSNQSQLLHQIKYKAARLINNIQFLIKFFSQIFNIWVIIFKITIKQ